MNNRYKIKVSDPLLRPGLTIETEASEAYVVDAMQAAMSIVREFNHPEPPKPEVTQRFEWYGTPEEIKRAKEQISDNFARGPGWRSGKAT